MMHIDNGNLFARGHGGIMNNKETEVASALFSILYYFVLIQFFLSTPTVIYFTLEVEHTNHCYNASLQTQHRS